MYATAEGKTDAPPSVGKEFVQASHGIKGLPEHVKSRFTQLNRRKQTP